jgi:hypothetical protein
MSYFDACANPVRIVGVGRRVIVPLRWFGPVYLIPSDVQAARLRRGFKWMTILTFVFVSVTAGWLGNSPAWLRGESEMMLTLIAWQALWVFALTRGLPKAGIAASDMPKLSRGLPRRSLSR